MKFAGAVILFACAYMTFGQSQPGAGGVSAPQNSVAPISREQGEEILNQLRLIPEELEDRNHEDAQYRSAPLPPAWVQLSVDPHWFALGRVDAPVTAVEFADFQCPYCNLFDKETFPEIKKAYIDTGKVRFVSLEFPLGIHPNARSAALAAVCAGSQGRYWEMRKAVIAGSPNLGADVLDHEAETLSLNVNGFRDCVKSGRPSTAIQGDVDEGEKNRSYRNACVCDRQNTKKGNKRRESGWCAALCPVHFGHRLCAGGG